MAEERVERRLAVILVADVVGKNGLIRADEEGTRAAVRQHVIRISQVAAFLSLLKL